MISKKAPLSARNPRYGLPENAGHAVPERGRPVAVLGVLFAGVADVVAGALRGCAPGPGVERHQVTVNRAGSPDGTDVRGRAVPRFSYLSVTSRWSSQRPGGTTSRSASPRPLGGQAAKHVVARAS